MSPYSRERMVRLRAQHRRERVRNGQEALAAIDETLLLRGPVAALAECEQDHNTTAQYNHEIQRMTRVLRGMAGRQKAENEGK